MTTFFCSLATPHLFGAALWLTDIGFAVPLVGAISLVYAATRHELPGPIFQHAIKLGMMLLGVMAAVFVVLWLIAAWL